MKTITKYWTVISIAALLLSAGWIAITARYAPPGTGGRIPAPRQGFLAPDFTLEALDGGSTQLSSLQGKAVLVNFWASWCAPCKSEMPAMQRVYQDYQDRGFTILAVNATSQDSRQQAAAFASDNGLTFPILLDTEGKIAAQYQVRALPTTFFVDREGNIHDMLIGGPISEALMRAQIEQMLAEAP
jgi:peroxiredoxin